MGQLAEPSIYRNAGRNSEGSSEVPRGLQARTAFLKADVYLGGELGTGVEVVEPTCCTTQLGSYPTQRHNNYLAGR